MSARTIKVALAAATSLLVAGIAIAHPLPTAPTEPFNPDTFWTDLAQSGS